VRQEKQRTAKTNKNSLENVLHCVTLFLIFALFRDYVILSVFLLTNIINPE